MFEEETTRKLFEKTQELLIASPSIQNSSSHQTSVSSFDPDSYRDDAFNIAAMLKAEMVVPAKAVALQVQTDNEHSSFATVVQNQSICSEVLSS